MKTGKLVVRRGKPRVYKGGGHQAHKWCVGIGKGNTPMFHAKTWNEAVEFAVWWYVNKFVMPLG